MVLHYMCFTHNLAGHIIDSYIICDVLADTSCVLRYQIEHATQHRNMSMYS